VETLHGEFVPLPDLREGHTGDGRGLDQIQVVDLAGAVTKRLIPPVFAQQIHLGSAAGLPDSAAALTF